MSYFKLQINTESSTCKLLCINNGVVKNLASPKKKSENKKSFCSGFWEVKSKTLDFSSDRSTFFLHGCLLRAYLIFYGNERTEGEAVQCDSFRMEAGHTEIANYMI